MKCEHIIAKADSRLCDRCLHYLFDEREIQEAQGRMRVMKERQEEERRLRALRGNRALGQVMDIESIRKRHSHMQESAPLLCHTKCGYEAHEDRGELLSEVDRLSDADTRALDAEDRIAALIAQRDAARAEVEKLRAETERMVREFGMLGELTRPIQEEAARLKEAGKALVGLLIEKIRATDPITEHDEPLIQASKRFCELIGAQVLREQKETIDQLRSRLTACRPVVERIDFLLRNLRRYDIEWEWIAEQADGQYLDRDEALRIVSEQLAKLPAMEGGE